jgi:hypothetical protein
MRPEPWYRHAGLHCEAGFFPRARWVTRRVVPVLCGLAVQLGCRSSLISDAPYRDSRLGEEQSVLTKEAGWTAPDTVTATMGMTVTRRGKPVRFSGILVAEVPDRMRCRADKSGRKVFDLTVNKEGYRLVRGRDRELIEGRWAEDRPLPEEELLHPRVLRAVLGFLGGEWDEEADQRVITEDSRSLTLGCEFAEGRLLRRIDKSTGLDREIVIFERSGELAARIRLEDYVVIRHVPWPMRIAVENPDRDEVVQIRFHTVELNEPLAEGAFAQSPG